MKRILIVILFFSFQGFSQTFSESVYVHTDKETYLSGEILWFKMYVLESKSFKISKLSKLGHLRLVDSEGQEVYKTVVDLDEEKGGSFYIPATIGEGDYGIEASTSVSSAAGQSYFKKIRVINPFKAPKEQADAKSANGKLLLFPEGGYLVKGLTSKIAFKTTDNEGHGISSVISLLDDEGSLINEIKSNQFGMGSFVLKPNERVDKVQAVFSGGEKVEASLPKALEEGYVLSVEAVAQGYNVKVSCNKDTFGTPQLQILGNRIDKKLLTLKQNTASEAEVFIAKEDLEAGVSVITLMLDDGSPFAERLIFKAPSEAEVHIKLAQKTYGSRQEVVSDFLGLDKGGTYSLAVRKVDGIQSESEGNIVSNLLLSKELKGTIENPGYFVSKANNEKVREDLEYLLLTQGWRKIILPEHPVSPETRFHKIKVLYTSRIDGSPIKDSDVMLNVSGKVPAMYVSKTDNQGVAIFSVKNLFGSVQLATFQLNKKPCNVELLTESTPVVDNLSSVIDYAAISQDLFDSYAFKVQTENIFYGKELVATIPVFTDSLAFYGSAETTYRLDDYTRFPLMEEVLREYIKEVNVRKRSGEYYFRALDYRRNSFFTDDPLILLDGVRIFSADQLINYDPLRVEKISVVSSKYFVGKESFGGIVDMKSYTGALPDFKLDPAITVFSYEGVQAQREYYTPSADSRKPDLRTVLYWNPNVGKSTNIRFMTSDMAGDYLLDLQGIDSKGTPISTSQLIRVD